MPTAARSRAPVVRWDVPLLLGLADLALGTLALVWPRATVAVLAVLVGIQLLLNGGVHLVRALFAAERDADVSPIAVAISLLYLFVGVLCLQDVMQTVAVLVLLVSLTLLVGGVLDLFSALAAGSPARWSTRTTVEALAGVVALAAGTVLLTFPEASVTILARLLGGWLVVLGATRVVVTIGMRFAGRD